MRVFLTFDTEVWCNGWKNLDASFPESFQRYVYGRSPRGDYALPKTLEILAKHGLRGVFFIEPLFSLRFGQKYLNQIVSMIVDAGQEVQLHLHPEWTDEITPPILTAQNGKRQYLNAYSLEEQTTLIGVAKDRLEDVLGAPVHAFRAGGYGHNEETFEALAHNDILIDSSLNRCYDISAPTLAQAHGPNQSFLVGPVRVLPVTTFKDGLGRQRPAQVSACSAWEFARVLDSAQAAGLKDFVIVSHNFEMLQPDSALPDNTVVKRFDRLCHYLARQAPRFDVSGFNGLEEDRPTQTASIELACGFGPTFIRVAEQALRRLH